MMKNRAGLCAKCGRLAACWCDTPSDDCCGCYTDSAGPHLCADHRPRHVTGRDCIYRVQTTLLLAVRVANQARRALRVTSDGVRIKVEMRTPVPRTVAVALEKVDA